MSKASDPIYPVSILPSGFKYPTAFLEWAKSSEANSLYPWVLIDAQGKVGSLLFSLRKSDGRNLIPFASLESGDGDVACFDGDDLSGNPSVPMLVLDGSCRSYAFSDFSNWLAAARSDAKKAMGS